MYYLIKNGHYINSTDNNRQKLCLLMFKHLVKNIKHLADKKVNWFGLSKWEVFKNNQKFNNTHKTIVEYCLRYEKEYLSFLKTLEVGNVR